MSNIFYPVLIAELSEEDGGGFVAYAPDLYGCMADGETPEEALGGIKGAISEWCDEARRLGRDVPAPFSVRDELHREREKVSKLLAQQAEAFATHKQDIEQLAADIERVKATVESIQDRANEKAPWDIVPLYAKQGRGPHLPH